MLISNGIPNYKFLILTSAYPDLKTWFKSHRTSTQIKIKALIMG